MFLCHCYFCFETFKVSKEINKVFHRDKSLKLVKTKKKTKKPSLLKILESMVVGKSKFHHQINKKKGREI